MENTLSEKNSALEALRQVLKDQFREAHRGVGPRELIRYGVDWIDQVGMRKASIAEVFGSSGGAFMSGGAVLIGQVLRYVISERQRLVLIDGSDSFDPSMLPIFQGTGTDESGLVVDDGATESLAGSFAWARCRSAAETVQIADLILRDGNFPRTMIDLQNTPVREIRSIPQSSWLRLRALTEEAGVSCLIMTPEPLISCAAIRFELASSFVLEDLECPEFVWEKRSRGRAVRNQVSGGKNFNDDCHVDHVDHVGSG